MSKPDKQNSLSPEATLMSLVMGTGMVQLIGVAAELGIADLLREGPMSAKAIAEATGTIPRYTYRVLRGLSNFDVIREHEQQRFSLTPVGAYLLKDVPGSFNALARMTSKSWFWQAFSNLLHTLKTGESGFRTAHGMSMFDWLSKNPKDASLFGDAMSTFSGTEVALILEAYDFSRFRCVVDVGGGHGMLLTSILDTNLATTGILFDMPDVVARTKSELQTTGFAERCKVIGGSFFDNVPSGGDLYLLKHVLHDWDDEKASQILKRIAEAMHPGAHLLVMEQGITPPGIPGPGKLMDISMMALSEGGMERTAEEHAKLLEGAGIQFTRTIHTPGPISIFEGVCSG